MDERERCKQQFIDQLLQCHDSIENAVSTADRNKALREWNLLIKKADGLGLHDLDIDAIIRGKAQE